MFTLSIGVMSMAVNYIGHYVVPGDWGNHPVDVTCAGGGRRSNEKRSGPAEISLTASCDSQNHLHIRVDLGSNNLPGINRVYLTCIYFPFIRNLLKSISLSICNVFFIH
jgi:hypothetical protein